MNSAIHSKLNFCHPGFFAFFQAVAFTGVFAFLCKLCSDTSVKPIFFLCVRARVCVWIMSALPGIYGLYTVFKPIDFLELLSFRWDKSQRSASTDLGGDSWFRPPPPLTSPPSPLPHFFNKKKKSRDEE